uniref:peptidylprolyl isomerase n=1 Tax=Guillardia theta TaxID=55529 RepID=A0A7S4LAB4_GUITH|mmetsp:Transcript_40380/g.127074  ORF Transcript_40380/g.127074 Transcript_40380/m.127074 type:complete len:177 (+) Transcript_40380:129-659(+)
MKRHSQNRKEIDSNEQRSKEFSFIFGDGQVIAGLEEGLSRISVGGEATLKISQALAYGEKPIGSLIPARANLLMEVKMIAVNDNDGTVVKHEEGGRLQEEEEEEEDEDEDEDEDEEEQEGNAGHEDAGQEEGNEAQEAAKEGKGTFQREGGVDRACAGKLTGTMKLACSMEALDGK